MSGPVLRQTAMILLLAVRRPGWRGIVPLGSLELFDHQAPQLSLRFSVCLARGFYKGGIGIPGV
jgi:hypothetical protein